MQGRGREDREERERMIGVRRQEGEIRKEHPLEPAPPYS